MVNTNRFDPDLVILSFIGVVSQYYFGLLPSATIFMFVGYFVVKRNVQDYNDSNFTKAFEMFFTLLLPILAFFYSFSCPLIVNDRFGVGHLYAFMRAWLGIDECWAMGSILRLFVWW
jgi:hypothetical protein